MSRKFHPEFQINIFVGTNGTMAQNSSVLQCVLKGYIDTVMVRILNVCLVFSLLIHFWETCDVEKAATEAAKGELSGFLCLWKINSRLKVTLQIKKKYWKY